MDGCYVEIVHKQVVLDSWDYATQMATVEASQGEQNLSSAKYTAIAVLGAVGATNHSKYDLPAVQHHHFSNMSCSDSSGCTLVVWWLRARCTDKYHVTKQASL